MFYIDPYYIILVVPTILLSMWAQFKVKSTFSHYSKIANSKGITGAQMAQYILRVNNISDVSIKPISGSLTDHYAPGNKTLRLSTPVYGQRTVSAIGVAAHEVGHAIQHAQGYGPLVLRSTLVPVANIGSAAGPLLAAIGLIFSFSLITKIGIVLFAASVLFYVVTLPVEINASTRAVQILRQSRQFSEEELAGVKKVLTAAAMTYVASALTAIASLLRLVLITRDRDD